MITRRFLLAAAAVTSAAAAIPSLPALAVEAAADAPQPLLPAWVVGTPGEWNFELVRAPTAEKAVELWIAENCDGFANEGEVCDCAACTWEVIPRRVTQWDNVENPTPADWLRVGLGHVCDRCGYECDPDMGAHPIGDDAVCEGCMRPEDWRIADPERYAEIVADGEMA